LVNRELYPEIPPRVEYDLTEVGRSLLPHIETLSAWAKDNLCSIMKSREAYALKKQGVKA
jgi:DNA-binding HxlR family transcriptional regulator